MQPSATKYSKSVIEFLEDRICQSKILWKDKLFFKNEDKLKALLNGRDLDCLTTIDPHLRTFKQKRNHIRMKIWVAKSKMYIDIGKYGIHMNKQYLFICIPDFFICIPYLQYNKYKIQYLLRFTNNVCEIVLHNA